MTVYQVTKERNLTDRGHLSDPESFRSSLANGGESKDVQETSVTVGLQLEVGRPRETGGEGGMGV